MESLGCRLGAFFVLGLLAALADTVTTDPISGSTTTSSETPSYSETTTDYATTTTDFTSSSYVATDTSTGSSIAPVACLLPFEEIMGRCLYVDPLETGSWYEMRLFCSILGEGSHLAFVNDADILKAVIDHIKKLGLDHSHYWVGASDEDHEGIWQWTDGTDVRMGAPYWKYDCVHENATQSQFPLRPQVDPERNCAGLDSNYHFLMTDFPCLGDQGLVPFAPICEGVMRAGEALQ